MRRGTTSRSLENNKAQLVFSIENTLRRMLPRVAHVPIGNVAVSGVGHPDTVTVPVYVPAAVPVVVKQTTA